MEVTMLNTQPPWRRLRWQKAQVSLMCASRRMYMVWTSRISEGEIDTMQEPGASTATRSSMFM